MKLSKKLIVTGLLFSSILGSVNISSITANAALGPAGLPTPENPKPLHPKPEKPVQKVRMEFAINYKINGKTATENDISRLNLPKVVSGIKGSEKLSGSLLKVIMPKTVILTNNEDGHNEYVVRNNSVNVDVNEVHSILLPPVQHITDNMRFIKIIFNDSFDDVGSINISKGREVTSIGLDEIKIPEGYRLRPKQDFTVQRDDKKGIDCIRLLVQKDQGDSDIDVSENNTSSSSGEGSNELRPTPEIPTPLKDNVKVILVHGTEIIDTLDVQGIDLDSDNSIKDSDLPEIKKVNYRYKKGIKHIVSIDKDTNTKVVRVELEKTKKVNLRYMIDGKDQKLDGLNKQIDVLEKDKKLDLSEIVLPSGYELVPNQTVEITDLTNGSVTTSSATIKIKKSQPQVDQIVNINYQDEKGFRVVNNKLLTTIKIDKKATKVSLKAIKLPAGYSFVNGKDVDIKNGSVTVIIKGINNVNARVNYVDSKTKKRVSSLTLNGMVNSVNKLPLPKGYKVTAGSSNVVTFSKDVTEFTIFVEKITTINTNIKTHISTISTHPGTAISLYNQNGKSIKNRALAGDSAWSSDKVMTLNGNTYYRVATNEWVKASDVYEYITKKGTVKTSQGGYKNLFTSKGKKVQSRGLASKTDWATDKVATINGQAMYRVATNEWVKAADIK